MLAFFCVFCYSALLYFFKEVLPMTCVRYPVIDLAATGENITRLRLARGLTVRDLQQFFGFDAPQAIYKWQRGQTLPSVDNLFALSALLKVPIDDILVASLPTANQYKNEQQATACCSAFLNRLLRIRRVPFHPSANFCRRSSTAVCSLTSRQER